MQTVNSSLVAAIIPKEMNTAAVEALIKKSGEDSGKERRQACSNRPFTGKVIQKTACKQFNVFLTSCNLFDHFQSGFRPNHSTETALSKVLNDTSLNADAGKVSALVLFDLRAAFDTADHAIL